MANVRVYFATNRNLLPDNKLEMFGAAFNPDGVAALRFGHADFATDGARPTAVDVYPEEAGDTEFKVLGSERFLKELHGCMAGAATDTLVFIHGFNVTFMSALTAAAELAREVKIGDHSLNVVLFSWPSDGKTVPLMSYYSDREDARVSGPAVARAYLKLKEFVSGLKRDDHCQQRLHLLAHSMGNYVLRQGLQAVCAKDSKALVRLFDQIILASADEDDDAFEEDDKLKCLPALARQVTVYHNPNDLALVVSDKTKTNPDRLGSDGPRLIDLLPKKVVIVDCRNVAKGADEKVQHSYYINSTAMAQDIGSVLAGTEPERFPNREYIPTRRAWRVIGELPSG